MTKEEALEKLDEWWDRGGFATSEAQRLAHVLREGRAEPNDDTLTVFPDDLRVYVEELARDVEGEVQEAAADLLGALADRDAAASWRDAQ